MDENENKEGEVKEGEEVTATPEGEVAAPAEDPVEETPEEAPSETPAE